MAETKKKLKSLIRFLEHLMEQDGNEWFHDELAILFSKKIISEKDTNVKLSAVTIKELGSIDKYLDEGLIPIVDYSKISNVKVRLQLERDSIEMGKSRLSNYSQKISFEKFCKYAHFQSEELVNYYFDKESKGNIDRVKEDIVNNTKIPMKDLDRNSTVSSIPHSMKLWAMSGKIKLIGIHNSTLRNISKVRNLEIHRSSTETIEGDLQRFITREDYNRIYESIVHLRNKIIDNVEN